MRTSLSALLAALALVPGAQAGGGPVTHEVLGRSALGRQIDVHSFGAAGTRRDPSRLLVVGCIHGDECAGIAVTERLVQADPPRATRIWVVHDLNPDGHSRGTRQNGRGVDLNRNFGAMWRPTGRRGDPQYAGPRPWSEPETRLIRGLILRIRPTVTIWFHQPQGLVRAWGPSIPAGRRYARLAGERFRALPWPSGTGPNWQNHRFPGSASFVVELAAGRLARKAAQRHADAILRLAE